MSISDLKTHILIVDDDSDFGRLMQINLEETGEFTCELATSAEAALKRLREGGVDLVTIDVMMPEHSGGWLFNEIRADQALAEVRVIVISALVEKSPGQVLPKRDPMGVISLWKPVDPDVLIGAIKAELQSLKSS
ncbi:MAG: response regulator [Verrucomicrobiota bacterium]